MSEIREWRPTRRAYLKIVTQLLQDVRMAEPAGGLWEAADLQWWWRVDQHDDRDGALMLLDGDRPVAAAVRTHWPGRDGWDLLGRASDLAVHADRLWDFVRARRGDNPIETTVRDDDPDAIARAEAEGVAPRRGEFVTCWLDPDQVRDPGADPGGFAVWSYRGGPHVMERRSGAAVAMRLAECSLYDRALDLSISEQGRAAAGYALFWADPVTRVGLVEPMRVEAACQRRGIGAMLLAAGLHKLAVEYGCERVKVSYEAANEAAKRLYLGAGFGPAFTSHLYQRG